MPAGNFGRPVPVGTYHSPLFASSPKVIVNSATGQTIAFDGWDKLALDLGDLGAWLTNFAAPVGSKFGRAPNNVFQQGHDAYRARVMEVFDTEGGSTSYRWAPLSPQRAAERQAEGVGAYHPILQATGDLRRAATWPDSSFSGQDISFRKEIDPHEMRLTLEGDKVQHDTGYEWNPPNSRGHTRRVPARPFWPDEELDRNLFFQPFVDWVDVWLAR